MLEFIEFAKELGVDDVHLIFNHPGFENSVTIRMEKWDDVRRNVVSRIIPNDEMYGVDKALCEGYLKRLMEEMAEMLKNDNDIKEMEGHGIYADGQKGRPVC